MMKPINLRTGRSVSEPDSCHAYNDARTEEMDAAGRNRTSEAAEKVSRLTPVSFESRLDPVALAAWQAGFCEGAFELPDDVVALPVGSGLVSLIDKEDAAQVAGMAWRAMVFPNGRIERVTGLRLPAGSPDALHRWLLAARDGECVDHRNHLPLDNRRSNLRLATSQQNAWNSWRAKGPANSSMLFGVSRVKGGWLAAIKHGGNRVFIGVFETELLAGLAYDEQCLEMRGEFAVLNFPGGAP